MSRDFTPLFIKSKNSTSGFINEKKNDFDKIFVNFERNKNICKLFEWSVNYFFTEHFSFLTVIASVC